MDQISKKSKPVVLVILDGWGEWDNVFGNAVANAKLPTIDELNSRYPKLLLDASGPAVGLPWGVYGNSEVGHQTIGSGQIIFQYLSSIDVSIQSGELETMEMLKKAFFRLVSEKKAFHLWGLCSDGGVHSHINHLLKMIDTAKKGGVEDIYIHFISDGRDTEPKVAAKYLAQLQEKLKEIGSGGIASVGGRYYGMDRNNNWDRIEKAYKAMAGSGEKTTVDPMRYLEEQYGNDITDEYIEPCTVVDGNGQPVGAIKEGDIVFCFNYRKDRSRQMTRAFVDKAFDKFASAVKVEVEYICMAEYEEGLCENVLYAPQKITTRVGGILSENGHTQLRVAETEKFAHVTYFFNGGNNDPFPGEDRIFVPSKNCKSYADLPEMSAYEVTDKLLAAIEDGKHDFVLVNYANSDMVGHTGVFEAGVKACEVVDQCLRKVIDSVLAKGGTLLITADHGNIEEMIKFETGKVDTEHSTNPVPCWLVAPDTLQDKPLAPGIYSSVECIIADIAPTILELFNIKPPKEMQGKSLLEAFYRKK